MNENNNQLVRTHNTVLVMITIACIAVIAESITQDWEFWVPPLLVGTLVGAWTFHIFQFRNVHTRENYYLIFGMAIAFFQGVHRSNFFDMIAISVALMAAATLVKRREFLNLIFIEYFVIMAVQLALENRYSDFEFDVATLVRVIFHVVSEICCYILLRRVIILGSSNRRILENSDSQFDNLKNDYEDLLFNISTNLANEKDPQRLAQRIGDIGEYSRICKGNIETCTEEYSIVSLIDKAVSFTERFESKQGVGFVVDLDPLVPSRMSGDPEKLLVIMEHLIDNAFKYTKRGGIYLHVSGIRHEEGFNLVIDVTDTGKGMSASRIDNIVKQTYMSGSDTENNGGIGIGLAIVYGYVRSMNGFVHMESVEQKGTNARVSVSQEITDPAPCMTLTNNRFLNVVCMFDQEVQRHPRVLEFYKNMADNVAEALRFNLYYATSLRDINRYLERGTVTHIVTGPKEYEGLMKQSVSIPADTPMIVCNSDPEAVFVGAVSLPGPVYSRRIFDVLNGKENVPPKEGGRK
ncbi:MAG: HAMP domain-containing histidine kinase [Lachnospiraceae bacterium]|nr:HAMP domain-containing histidine kinase [Lachnospiraceae bacterium]